MKFSIQKFQVIAEDALIVLQRDPTSSAYLTCPKRVFLHKLISHSAILEEYAPIKETLGEACFPMHFLFSAALAVCFV